MTVRPLLVLLVACAPPNASREPALSAAPLAEEVVASPSADLTGAGVYAGLSLGTGDFDGDGYQDLAAGSYTGGLFAPVVTTFPGSSAGLDPAVSYQGSAGTVASYWGAAVDGLGDVDADGYDDLVVGAGVGSFVTVHLGGPGGWTAPGTEMDGSPGTNYGSSVAGVGDVDGDGYADMLVGAPSPYGLTAAWFYRGGPAGLDPDAAASLFGSAPGDGFGTVVAGIGDVDADGYRDVAVSGNGSVAVFRGGPGGLVQPAAITLLDPVAGGTFGQVVSAAGDVDGDGYDDVLVSDPSEDTGGVGSGSVYVFAGGPAGLSASPRYTLVGVEAGAAFGQDATGVGDTNDDGYAEIAVGAFLSTGTNGQVQVFLGSAGGPVAPPATLVSPFLAGYLGYAIAGADFDGDGLSDVAASAYAVNAILVYRGIIDADHDGYDTDVDCDDGSSAVNPGAAEVCDGIDDDCDGTADQGAVDAPTWYADADQDGFGDPATAVASCTALAGYVSNHADCNDTLANAFPGAVEVCDGVDDDCDGTADLGAVDASTWYADGDHDGFGDPATAVAACAAPPGHVADSSDCNDTLATVHPGAVETCDGRDDDCNGDVDSDAVDRATWYGDSDGDGFGDPGAPALACVQPNGTSADGTDCDDTAATVHPTAAEVCNGVDDDCDDAIDDGATDATAWYGDSDGDGYGDPAASTLACDQPADTVADGTDCDDTAATVHPTAAEICNGVDDDCDDAVDVGATDASTWYADADGDGFGDPTSESTACDQPSGSVGDDTDCDDASADVFPGATEIPGDGVDQDCNGADAEVPAPGGDTGTGGTDGSAGCGCETSGGTPPFAGLLAIGLALGRRRRRG